MKILFWPGDYPFCYYYRGFLPGVYAKQMVVKDFVAMGKNVSIETMTKQAREADVVVFQRPNNGRVLELARLLKIAGKKIIFENDDTYKVGEETLSKLDNDKQRAVAADLRRYTDAVLALADGAIASTPILAEEYRRVNPKVVVLKNCIDPLDELPNKANTTGKFRIGFIASVTTNDDYIHLKEQIRALDERGDITIVVLGLKYKDGSHIPFMDEDVKFWHSLKNAEFHAYVPVTHYMSKVASLALDLAVIPRADNYFNRCKSNLKFLEMSLLRIPVIAQGFADGTSPYQGPDAMYMTIVADNSTWYNKIVEIKEHYPTFLNLADEAHDYVLANYNIKNYAQEWVKQIEKLCLSPQNF